MADNAKDLVERLRAERWQAGVEQRPHGIAWHGQPPIVEAFEEALDLLNYLEQDEREGGENRALFALADSIAQGLARAIARRYFPGDATPPAWSFE